MRVQFGQHNPVDRRRWRHEIDFVILRPEGPSQKGRRTWLSLINKNSKEPLRASSEMGSSKESRIEESRRNEILRRLSSAQDDVIGTAIKIPASFLNSG